MNNKESKKEINDTGYRIDLSIIIINYNLAKEIENCLNSLLKNINSAGQLNYEVIVVDNNSPDKDLPAVEEKFKLDNFKFYYLNENVGFGKGCNFGFSKAEGRYIFFLNPDTIIKEDIFPAVINLFESDNSIGIIGPKQETRPPLFDFSAGHYSNVLFELLNLAGMGVFFDGFVVSLLTKLKKNKNMEVDWILGAAIFIRNEIFKQINGFDKDFFMFFEEVDLCRRVKRAGYKIIYAPALSIHHIGSVSGKKDYKLYTIRTYASKYIYISKHYGPFRKNILKALLFLQLFSQIIIWTILSFRNKQKSKQKIEAFVFLIKNRFKY